MRMVSRDAYSQHTRKGWCDQLAVFNILGTGRDDSSGVCRLGEDYGCVCVWGGGNVWGGGQEEYVFCCDNLYYEFSFLFLT